MNILLVRPYWPYPYSRGEDTYNRIWPPLCLANCASLLEREGHRVRIIDASLSGIRPRRIKKYVEGYDKVFITSSSLDRWQCPNIDISGFLETARCVKKATNEVYVLGYHCTIDPGKMLALTGAKGAIRGEPEITVLEICRGNDLSGISGVSYLNNGRLISNAGREQVDLKTLPLPAYHLLEIKKYHYEILGKNFLLFELSRGCRYVCSFCNKAMYGKGIRLKSGEQIIRELEAAVEKFGCRSGYFIDLDFLSDRQTAEEICDFLIGKNYGFIWSCQTRPTSFDIAILKKMRKAGCRLIHLGIESLSQGSLKYLNKGISILEIERAVSLCREAGLRTLAFFLFGLPDETMADRYKSFEAIKKLDADFVSFHKLTLYENILDDNFKAHTEVDSFLRTAVLKYYLRPSRLKGTELSGLLSGLRLFLGRINSLR